MGSYDNYYYKDDEQMAIYIADLICASLSILGCCFILILCVFFPNLRRLPFRMIIYLTISDLGSSIAFALPYYKSYAICQAQGYMSSYFSLSSIMWSACISHAIKSTIIDGIEVEKNVKKYFFISFFLPSLCFLVLFDIKEYKLALGWCWIYLNETMDSEFYRQIVYRFITYYVPLCFVIGFILYNYWKISRVLKDSESLFENENKVAKAMILKLKLYPVILILSMLPVIIMRMVSLGWLPGWELTLVSGIGLGLNGFLNSVVYGLTQEVKIELRKLCKSGKSERSSSLVEVG
jgi:hypothetical protein